MITSDFEITIWHKPHRGDGYLVHIDTAFFGSNIYRQSPAIGLNPEFNPDAPHKVQTVSGEWLSNLAEQFDRTTVSLAAHGQAQILGGSHYGLRLLRGLQTLTLVWAPRFEDQTEQIRVLWALVDGAVEA